MATFTITALTNIDSLASKAGGDTYNVNGGTLVIDQDSRYGTNQGTGTTLGNVTISATLGGAVQIEGRYVRLIPFDTGTGTVPTSNTTISQGGASGLLIGVWSSLTAAPVAAGSAMPASGWLKIKQWNSTAFSAGALTGVSAAATGADSVGWLDIVGDEATTFTIPRLGSLSITGEWYPLGVTSGDNLGTYQLPTSGVSAYCPGVWVEKTVGGGVYEFYPNAGSTTAVAANFSSDWRSKVCWVSTAGVVRFGNDGTNATGGYVPSAGLNVRVPNIFLNNAAVASRSANALPNATLATRYETATTGGALISIDKASCGWYLNMSQPYSVSLTNTGVFDTIVASEVASAIAWSQVGVGQSAAVITFGLSMSLNFAGGTLTDCVFTSTSLAASGRYVISLSDMTGFTFTRVKSFAYAARGNATTGSITLTRVNNSTFANCIIGSGRALQTTCDNLTWSATTYFDNQAVNTTSTNPMYLFDLASGCSNILMDGVDFGGLYLTQPYNGILQVGAAGCTSIKLRNLGAYASPLSLGSPRVDDAAWTRSTTTATVTSNGHGFAVGNLLWVVVSSDISAIVVGSKTITAVTTNTFQFTCLNAGSASGTLCFFGTMCANLFVLASGAAANTVKIQRCYAPHTRTNLFTADNSSKNIILEDVLSDYLNAPLFALLNGYFKQTSGTFPMTAQTAVYGVHWFDGYVTDIAANTSGQSWTRSGTTVTVTSAGHSLRTGMFIVVNSSSNTAGVPLGYKSVTCLSSSTFTFTGVNSGTTSGTLDYRVINSRIGLMMNEATADTSNQYTVDAGNPVFTSAGGLYMPNVNDQITFVTPNYILGHGSSFPINELIMGGSTLTRYTTTYALDKNDGNGFGSFHNLYYERAGGSGTSGQFTFTVTDATGVEQNDYAWGTGVAPNAKVTGVAGNTITVDTANTATVSGIIRFNHLPYESGLSSSLGFKMKWRIKTVTANTVAITSLYIGAESNATDRANQYPLETYTASFTGVVTGSDVVVLSAGTSTILQALDSIPGTTASYTYSSAQTVDVGFIKQGYVPMYIRNLSLGTADISLPISQTQDRNFL